ncbi:hypothetical protein [Streptomyces sp. NPDC047097]|uniref:hypothetical protein n=1 Tax=Streptomyces sp. NPDC047097 TaxID=3155260 RepID=UPI0033C4A850
MTAHRSDWDFGLSRLTKFFAGPWSHERTVEETIADAAAGHTDEPPGAAASVILADAVRLEESSLPTEVIATLWAVASDGGYDLAYFGVDARDWLRRVAAVCAGAGRSERTGGASLPAVEPVTVSGESVRAVVEAIRSAAPALEAKAATYHGQPAGEVVRGLELVATQVDPDLGFRLFLRVLGACRVPISQGQYDRYESLGSAFGYGRFHVSDVEYLTRY